MRHKLLPLDGWRGISILLVLCTHLLPLGPRDWKLNGAAGVAGMALFFVLSGFLITRLLLADSSISRFLTRRLLRIGPLYVLYVLIVLAWVDAPFTTWWRTLSFTANLPPVELGPVTAHLWSLCLEVQFYFLIAFGFMLLGRRVLPLLPVIALFITGLRAYFGIHASSISYYRADEILAGCLLAVICEGLAGDRLKQMLTALPVWPVGVVFLLSCHDFTGSLNYARPYLAASLVGITLLRPGDVLARLLSGRTLAYIASISYALYMLHPGLAATWLGSGDLLEKYAKRPLLFLVLWALAHLSTRHFERRFIELGHRLTQRRPVASPS